MSHASLPIESIVIVGAGQAAASAILALRAQQYQGQIILIGDELHRPYERPPLSKDVLLQPENYKVEILSEEKLKQLGVTHIAGQAVLKLDPSQHVVHVQDGTQIHYDKLLLATGGAARRLPNLDALGKHVYTLRNLDDALALLPVLQAERHIVLVGGGVIGLELASSARAKGCKVTVLELGNRLMGRSTPEIFADFLLSQHRCNAVDVRLNTQIADCQLLGDQVQISLNNGERLLADAVIYGVGIIPNAQLAQEAGLAVDFAIQVNEHCQSSDADIYAAGDVATQLRVDGAYRRVETWENANLQAEIFARHVMGVAHPQPNPAWFWTDQLNVNYQFVGDMAADEWFVRGEMNPSAEQPSFILFGVSDQQIVAAITVNAAKDMRHLKKMIAKQTLFCADQHLDLSQALRAMA